MSLQNDKDVFIFFSHFLLCVSFHSYYFLCWLLFYLLTESWGWHCLSLHVCVCTISAKTYTLMSAFSLELTIYRLSYPPDIATKTIFSETFHLQQVYETHVFLLLRYELSSILMNIPSIHSSQILFTIPTGTVLFWTLIKFQQDY